MANITDGRCWRELRPASPSLFQDGKLVFQAHYIGWIVTGCFTLVAIITSAWLINKHLVFYSDKREQRYIVRILFMVPIYAIISFASYLFWNDSTPLLLIQDGYESTVLTSFFYLLLCYLSHDPDEQRAIFLKNGISRENDREALRKGETPRKWIFPLGLVKWKPVDGLYFLQVMKWGVLQYCVVRPTTTLAAVLLDYVGLYCEDSWGPGWGHVYITVIVSISVTIAMYCLLQLYVSVSKILAPQKPLLKLFAIKAIVFLTFWQATFLSVLSMFGVVKDTTYMTADDINIGIGAIAETFEMMLFGFIHIKAFTYKPYRPSDLSDSKELPAYRMSRLRALGHAFDFRETFRELWIGMIYMWDKMRGRDPKPDNNARRTAHYESAFEAPRPSGIARSEPSEKKDPLAFPMIRVEREYYDSNHGRQWLGHGDDYGYGIFREKSDGLEIQFERELERRGYGSQKPPIKPATDEENTGLAHQPQRSWWRSIYNRVSQSGPEDDNQNLTPASSRHASHSKSKPKSRKPSKSRSRNPSRDEEREQDPLSERQYDMDDPPPPSLFRSKWYSRQTGIDQRAYSPVAQYGDEDTLAPLSAFNDHRDSYLQRHHYQVNVSQRREPNHSAAPPMFPINHNHPTRFSSGLPSSPPPQSLLAPLMVPQGDVSADILLGRVFPSSSDAHLTAHGTDSTHSTGYVHSRPRTTPSREDAHTIGVAAERRPVHGQDFNTPAAMSATGISPIPIVNADHSVDKVKQDRTLSLFLPQVPSPPHAAPASPNGRSGLRRSSAQVYSPHENPPTRKQAQFPVRSSLPERSKRHSTPVILTVPRPLVTSQGNAYSADSPHAFRLSLDNPARAIAQDSFPGQLDNPEFPSPLPEENNYASHGGGYYRYPEIHHGNVQPPLTSQQLAQSRRRTYEYPSDLRYNASRGGAGNGIARFPQGRSNTTTTKDQPIRDPWFMSANADDQTKYNDD